MSVRDQSFLTCRNKAGHRFSTTTRRSRNSIHCEKNRNLDNCRLRRHISYRETGKRELKMHKNGRERYLPVAMFPAIMPVIMLPGMKSDLSPYLYYGIWGLSLGLAIMGVTWMANGAPSQTAKYARS
jgi:hypothetical protein